MDLQKLLSRASLSHNVFQEKVIARRINYQIIQGQISPINNAVYSPNSFINVTIKREALELYNRMLATRFRCDMQITVYNPLTPAQIDAINANHAKLARTAGNTAGAVAGLVIPGKVVTKAAFSKVASGVGVGSYVHGKTLENLRKYYVGDVYVHFDAKVSGGIGPQHSTTSVLVRREAYNPTKTKI